MTKSELREMIRECLREELKSNRLTEGHEIFDLGRGYYADIDQDQYELHPERINVEIYKDTTGWQNPHYDKYITTVRSVDEAREYISSLREDASLIESSLSAEEKVDAWHAGTRRENYKAAGIPKLQTFLDIAKRKGYTEIVDIIEGEFIRRGVTPAASASITTTSPVSTSTAPTSEVEPDIEAPVTDAEEPAESSHFSDALVKELEAPVLSDKEKDILIGQTIDYLGKVAFYARSYWRTAMGFIGSYSTTWYNGNGNEVKADRAKDRVRDLTYASDRLVVLRSHFDGGSHNIDRYYSIEVPSSTKYIVDTDKIRDMMYSSYYDSEIDWRISTLTKTTANRKKFKQYLIDTAGMPIDQAEELTAYAFDKRVW
jgi:hypothetical protein